MTKNDLNEYFWLNHEIKRQKSRLKRLEEKLKHSGEVVGDSVQKYYNGKAHPYKIEGIAETDIQLPLMIVTLKAEIETNIDKAEKKAVEIEQFFHIVRNRQRTAERRRKTVFRERKNAAVRLSVRFVKRIHQICRMIIDGKNACVFRKSVLRRFFFVNVVTARGGSIHFLKQREIGVEFFDGIQSGVYVRFHAFFACRARLLAAVHKKREIGRIRAEPDIERGCRVGSFRFQRRNAAGNVRFSAFLGVRPRRRHGKSDIIFQPIIGKEHVRRVADDDGEQREKDA